MKTCLTIITMVCCASALTFQAQAAKMSRTAAVQACVAYAQQNSNTADATMGNNANTHGYDLYYACMRQHGFRP